MTISNTTFNDLSNNIKQLDTIQILKELAKENNSPLICKALISAQKDKLKIESLKSKLQIEKEVLGDIKTYALTRIDELSITSTTDITDDVILLDEGPIIATMRSEIERLTQRCADQLDVIDCLQQIDAVHRR